MTEETGEIQTKSPPDAGHHAPGAHGNEKRRSIQTLAEAYRQIRRGTKPWIALNEFFHEWLDYSREQRGALIAEPILSNPRRGHESPELWRWAVFCVAAAEYLCTRDGVPCPKWLTDPAYTLREPWYRFGDPSASSPDVRERLERTTPEPLRRRNILGGGRVFADKYAAADDARRQRGTGEQQPV